MLRGVDVTLETGQVLGVLGPTGAGKTTLFKALVGELVPSQGQVWLGVQQVTTLPLWRRARLGIGYMAQGPSVFVDLSVRNNLVTYEALAKRGNRGASYWAQRVGLDKRMDVRAGDLSGGERRLLELARVMVMEPKVVVCDEPFAGIDPLGAGKVARQLRMLANGGVGVMLSDHHAAIALGICDRAGLLVDGAIQLWESPQRWQADERVRRYYLG